MTVNDTLASWIQTWFWIYLSSPLMYLLIPLVILLVVWSIESSEKPRR